MQHQIHTYIPLLLALDSLGVALFLALGSLLGALLLLLADLLPCRLSLSLPYLLKLFLVRTLSLTGSPSLSLALYEPLLLRARPQLVQVNLLALRLWSSSECRSHGG